MKKIITLLFMMPILANSQNLNYSGSIVSQQEMSCYQIELINLVLPNDIKGIGKVRQYVVNNLDSISSTIFDDIEWSWVGTDSALTSDGKQIERIIEIR